MPEILCDLIKDFAFLKERETQATSEFKNVWVVLKERQKELIKERFKRLPAYRIELIKRLGYMTGIYRGMTERDIRMCEILLAKRNAKLYKEDSS